MVSAFRTSVDLEVGQSRTPINIDAIVLANSNYDVVLGMSAISRLGGLFTCKTGRINLKTSDPERLSNGCAANATKMQCKLKIEKPDFEVEFDGKKWIAKWKWRSGSEPGTLPETVAEYFVDPKIRNEYVSKLESWKSNNWLVAYDEEVLGPPKALIPLFAVVQRSKNAIRPIMNYTRVNEFVETFTAESAVCNEKIRKWRKKGDKCAIVDLKDAYLQIHVDKELWPYQTVILNGTRYCLTRLGFGLNVAPCVMQSVMDKIFDQDALIASAADAYIDDVFVDESKTSIEYVVSHLNKYGLKCKRPESLSNARILGLRVSTDTAGVCQWERDNLLPEISENLTKRSLFSLCGSLTGCLPVCGWLRVACSMLKRMAGDCAWDAQITDQKVLKAVIDTVDRVRKRDPSTGVWSVSGEEGSVWCDASSIAMGALLQVKGKTVEDAAWLRKRVDHINMAELEAATRGLNMAIQWGMKKIKLYTDSANVHAWLSNALIGKSRLKTKAEGAMLIRRRVENFLDLVNEYELSVVIELVPSSRNKSDELTRVPKHWLTTDSGSWSFASAAQTGDLCADTIDKVRELHERSHCGVRRTLHLCKMMRLPVSKRSVQDVVAKCVRCASIDPHPIIWPGGELSTEKSWQRLAVDVTKYEESKFLTVKDCGPSRFSIWRRITRETAEEVCAVFRSVISEFGPPAEVLLDNSATFRSDAFRALIRRWDVSVLYRAAYRPSGNGIVERSHRAIKSMAARARSTPEEAAFWYNRTPSEDGIVPIDLVLATQPRFPISWKNARDETKTPDQSRFSIEEEVFVKPPQARCTTPWNVGKVTKVISQRVVDVDGMPRHVADVRSIPEDSRRTGDLAAERDQDAASGNEGLRRSGRRKCVVERYAMGSRSDWS